MTSSVDGIVGIVGVIGTSVGVGSGGGSGVLDGMGGIVGVSSTAGAQPAENVIMTMIMVKARKKFGFVLIFTILPLQENFRL
jgi:hypothetical protein